MFMKKGVFSILGIFAFLIFSQFNVFACSCPTVMSTEQEVKWKLKRLQAVFSGRVVEINRKPHTRDVLVKIRVERFWKGVLYEDLRLTTPESPGACGYTFEIGKSYLVFASRSAQGDLATGLCLNNKELEKATEELEILGIGKKPKRNKSSNLKKV